MVHVNTFHIPSVESTLLHTFSKGTAYETYATMIFQDTLRQTMRFMQMGYHIGDPDDDAMLHERLTVGDIIKLDGVGPNLQTLRWIIPLDRVVWTPKRLDSIKLNRATKYSVLMALYWRVNGAADLFARYRSTIGTRNALPKGDITGTKVREFVDRHLALAMYMDSLDDPCDSNLDVLHRDVASGGPTDFLEDRDRITCVKRAVRLEDTPLEVLNKSGVFEDYELDDFAGTFDMEIILARHARRIRDLTDEQLVQRYVPQQDPDSRDPEEVGAEAFEFYNPMHMQTPEDCRTHSWFLACLTVINRAWGETIALCETETKVEDEEDIKEEEDEEDEEEYDDDDDDEEDGSNSNDPSGSDDDVVMEDVSPDEPITTAVSLKNKKNRRAPVLWKHSAVVRHAFHRIVGSFVQLMYHAIKKNKFTDEQWRMKPEEESLTVLDQYFPYDTVCFHAGDLPSLHGVLDQVGLYGVQAVKNKIPLVRMLMKSLPVCCQSRDLVGCFVNECRLMNGEGKMGSVCSIICN